MIELNEKQLEQIAHAFRDTIYTKPQEDPKGWEACRENWVKDLQMFQAKLAKLGFEIVPVKKTVVNLEGGGRFG